ncbi:hypothetical protein GMA10_06145 [Kocuria koreensis]|uniref:Uncharacterized protein n=1 Tax=Rothia koreensis TaxID=592378 RepID=A0A7K1LIB3_9MICC|nr:hypothetical protein [Rothia koreensis]MUN54793.1 hypothetical protein [Rothia koreensis]
MKIDWTGKQRRERNAAAGAPDGPKRKRGCLGCLGIIVVIIVIAAIASAVGGGSNNDDEKKSGDKASSSSSSEAPKERVESELPPTEEPKSEKPAPDDPEAAMKKQVNKALKSSGAKEAKFSTYEPSDDSVWIKFQIRDALSKKGMVKGAQRDTAAILDAIREAGVPGSKILIEGDVNDAMAFNLAYSPDTINSQNWSSLEPAKVWDLRDSGGIMPEFTN